MIYYTYTLPDLEVRRTQPAARIAYFAYLMLDRNTYINPVVGMCVSCGRITSYSCDTCKTEGRRFTTMAPWSQPMWGSPICLVCMHDPQVECTVCGVTVYDWMD